MIEVKELTKRYGRRIVVDHLSFRIEKGQIYGFLGPNGAGKTTTLNMITGYTAPTSGQVKLQGKDMAKEGERARRQIGYLPEIPPLYPDMTVQEYLDFAAGLKKIPRSLRKDFIARGMEQTGITDVKHRLIRNLSKGYCQRIGLAQALLGDPEIVILDEPMVGLDPAQIVETRELIRSLRTKHTVILSSHILSEISAICDHILILSHGKLAAGGSPGELVRRMEEKQKVELSVKGRQEELQTALGTIEKIREIRWEEPAGEGETRVVLHVEEDIREELFFALAGHKMPILELALVKPTLEEVFLEYTEPLTRTREKAAAEDSFPSVGEPLEAAPSDTWMTDQTQAVETRAAEAQADKTQTAEMQEGDETGNGVDL